MLRFLSKVRRSMLAARRTYPIATDFETAIDVLDIPRPDDQLAPYQTQPSINPPLLPTPPPEDEFHNLVELPASFLGPGLDGHGELKRFSFTTKGLPELPSAHTYRDTPVYPDRQSDSRKIRELATHEGKLGEQALRKLAGAVKLDAAHPLETEIISSKQKPPVIIRRKRWKTGVDLSEDAVFEETLRDLLAKEHGGFELGPIVNCEKSYRMPEELMTKRGPANSSLPEKRSGSGLQGGDVAMQL
ncbi:bromodomain associated domain protein [Fonsecaea pedrosoi]|nr:bromodomain associated domain protein [Fonsecaea pedrosoi]